MKTEWNTTLQENIVIEVDNCNWNDLLLILSSEFTDSKKTLEFWGCMLANVIRFGDYS